ncbi:pirin-like C-terminal cupin domain-containing protein [Flavobacterium sp. GSB-24]|uniref:pirin family protein n=1 Tax=Flavobacterium sp. GSB-24 TaxID=2994319 RepID=UPI0024920D3F|nr:pirin-like C-terminal cupin domain-containing protein [Flavobacterium sp. GSB-24]BDU25137.1 quercetin 2,3-dioxygenase [Flavobacterium sp. GSB-24]
MQKKFEYTYRGHSANIAEMVIFRMLPNHKTKAVGPFVFLDYISRVNYPPRIPQKPDGHGAHPHRGIATFTYLLHGEFEHYDSRDQYGVVNDGGGQWMKAGNGIIHDENFSQEFQKNGGLLLGLQFWINLPSKAKKEQPDYMAVQDADLPKINLFDDAGILKIVIGSYAGETSKVKTFSKQFLYHITLTAGKSFTMPTESAMEYAAFLPNGNSKINETELLEGELVVFEKEGTEIQFTNNSIADTDILVFGGENYDEPIVTYGPFVMNTKEEIAEAYNDFYAGKYGVVTHSKGKNGDT